MADKQTNFLHGSISIQTDIQLTDKEKSAIMTVVGMVEQSNNKRLTSTLDVGIFIEENFTIKPV